ncbi:MAG: flagellar basal body rod protein FlgB [Planctomycetaceae bacterium]
MDPITRQIGNLDQLLDATAMRQRVLAQNIANVNTPGYHRQDVSFEEHLDASGGAANVEPQVYEEEGLEERADGNNVDIDHEIGALNRNAMKYQTWVQVLSSRISQMQHAIRGS